MADAEETELRKAVRSAERELAEGSGEVSTHVLKMYLADAKAELAAYLRGDPIIN